MWAIYAARAIQIRSEVTMETQTAHEFPSPEDFPMFGVYRDELLENEEFISYEIDQLWQRHQSCNNEIKSEQFRQRAVGNSLGQLLHAMKRILVSPGRNGKWSGWLKERKISRATADRLVIRYAQAFNLLDKPLSESIKPEPTEIEIGRLFAALWPRMETLLTTDSSRYEFLRCYLYRSGLNHQWQDDGILVYEPGHEPAPASRDHDGEATLPTLAGDYGGVL
jgi:hypothetical protein